MGAPTSSYATAGIALRVSGALNPHHHDKVETPSVGLLVIIYVLISGEGVNGSLPVIQEHGNVGSNSNQV
jgi:hypothetical protein